MAESPYYDGSIIRYTESYIKNTKLRYLGVKKKETGSHNYGMIFEKQDNGTYICVNEVYGKVFTQEDIDKDVKSHYLVRIDDIENTLIGYTKRDFEPIFEKVIIPLYNFSCQNRKKTDYKIIKRGVETMTTENTETFAELNTSNPRKEANKIVKEYLTRKSCKFINEVASHLRSIAEHDCKL